MPRVMWGNVITQLITIVRARPQLIHGFTSFERQNGCLISFDRHSINHLSDIDHSKLELSSVGPKSLAFFKGTTGASKTTSKLRNISNLRTEGVYTSAEKTAFAYNRTLIARPSDSSVSSYRWQWQNTYPPNRSVRSGTWKEMNVIQQTPSSKSDSLLVETGLLEP